MFARALIVVLVALNLGVAAWWLSRPEPPLAPLPVSDKGGAELQLLPGADHSFGGMHPYEQDELPEPARRAADFTIEFFNIHA